MFQKFFHCHFYYVMLCTLSELFISRATKAFRIERSTNNNTFETVVETEFENPLNWTCHDFPVEVYTVDAVARYFKVSLKSAYGLSSGLEYFHVVHGSQGE